MAACFTLHTKSSLPYPIARGETCPQRLRIYANRPSGVDFADAETFEPHLDMSILEGDASVTEYPLRVAAFANVSSLTLFFVSHRPVLHPSYDSLVSHHVLPHFRAISRNRNQKNVRGYTSLDLEVICAR